MCCKFRPLLQPPPPPLFLKGSCAGPAAGAGAGSGAGSTRDMIKKGERYFLFTFRHASSHHHLQNPRKQGAGAGNGVRKEFEAEWIFHFPFWLTIKNNPHNAGGDAFCIHTYIHIYIFCFIFWKRSSGSRRISCGVRSAQNVLTKHAPLALLNHASDDVISGAFWFCRFATPPLLRFRTTTATLLSFTLCACPFSFFSLPSLHTHTRMHACMYVCAYVSFYVCVCMHI